MARKVIKLLDYIKGEYVYFIWDEVQSLTHECGYVKVGFDSGRVCKFDKKLFEEKLMK